MTAEATPPAPPSQRERSWATVRPFLIGLASFAVLAAVDEARGFTLWRNYALSGVVLGGATTWLLWRYDVRVPAYIQWVIVAGLVLHYGGGSLGSPDPFGMGLLGMHGVNGAYHEYSWWDNLTHAVGIGAGAMAIAYLVEAYQMRRGLDWDSWAVGTVAFLGALAAGVAVELYEYLGKAAFQTIDQGGYLNTMRDLQFNILGAGLGAVLAVVLDRRRFAARIREHWGRPEESRADLAWDDRLTPGLMGFVASCLPPAVSTLVLAVRFEATGVPADDLLAYDPALQTLLWSAVTGLLGGAVATLASRRWARKEATG